MSVCSMFLFILLTDVHCKTWYDRNLIKSDPNCVDAKISHIGFKNDSLVFQFAKSKGHQNIKYHVGPWHIYENPHETHICPVLALARYLLRQIFNFYIWWTKPECRYFLESSVQQYAKIKGVDTGRQWGLRIGNIMLQIDFSKPPIYISL